MGTARIRAAIVLLFAFIAPVFAQEPNTSALHGTVTDQTGGVIVGAAVELSNGAARTWTVTTDPQGRYAFDRIPPGSYTVTVDASGFLKRATQVELRPDAVTALDVGIEIAVSIAIDVSEADLSMDARRNLSAMTLTRKEIDALPDDPQLFLRRLFEMAGSTGVRGDVAVYIDGFRNYKHLPPKSIIETIRINSNPFSAEFSQQSIRRIEITTKPGSDQFHGDGTFQVRSSRLNARNPLAETGPTGQYRNYNGYLQGPLRKDRVGFLVYAGQWQQDDNANVHATVLGGSDRLPQPYAATVSTPATVTAGDLKLDFRLFNQLINASYGRVSEQHRNQGLESGFDLPSRAYDRLSTNDAARVWWTTLGRRSVNDVRVEVTRDVASRTAATSAPALLVLDAFNAGGNQDAASRSTTTAVQASERLTVAKGRHTLKTGVQLETIDARGTDRTGFGGTFTFGADVERDSVGQPVFDAAGQAVSIAPLDMYRRTLLGLPGYGPSQFAIVDGNPNVAVAQWNLGWFTLDDWSISKRLSLSYGVRQELQNNVPFRTNLAPRISLSWLLDEMGKSSIKLGAGIFYTPVEADITLQTRKLDGTRRQQIIVQHPSFLTSVPSSFDATAIAQSVVYVTADDLRVPSSFISTLAYERELAPGLFVAAQYLFGKGVDQLRLRALTAPVAATLADPGSSTFQFESTGRSIQHELMLSARADISRSLDIYSNYRLGKKNSDTDGAYTLPADSYDLRNEYGASITDRRHQITAGMTAGMPGGLRLAPELTILSGRPFNITTGLDNNGDTVFTDRPAFAERGDPTAVATRFGVFTPHPRPGDTIIPRNLGREPWQVNVDLAVSKTVLKALTITADAENLLNTPRLFGSNGVLTSPLFGQPNQALSARRFELTTRYGF